MRRFWAKWLPLVALPVLALLCASAAQATQAVAIQFIDVCGTLKGGGTSCAPDTAQQLQTYVNYANAIFSQANIKIAPVTTVNQITIDQLANPAYGACGSSAASIFCTDLTLSLIHI